MTSFYYKIKLPQLPPADDCDSGYVTCAYWQYIRAHNPNTVHGGGTPITRPPGRLAQTSSSVCSDHSYKPSTSTCIATSDSHTQPVTSADTLRNTVQTRQRDMGDASALGVIDDEALKGINKTLAAKWHRAFHVFFVYLVLIVASVISFSLINGTMRLRFSSTIKTSRGEDSRDYATAKQAMESIWASLLEASDVDKDRKVTMDEWKHMWYESIKDDRQAKWQQLYLEYMFRLFDSTGDDLIDLSEYIEVMAYYGISREEATWAFDHFALSEDGHQLNAITYDTYIKLWKEYFRSTDPNAPGNYLLGDVSGEFDPSTYVAA